MPKPKPQIFVMWKKYNLYSYLDCVSQRLFNRFVHRERNWEDCRMNESWEMHKAQIKYLRSL